MSKRTPAGWPKVRRRTGWQLAAAFVLSFWATGFDGAPASGKVHDAGWERSRPVDCTTLDQGGYGPFHRRGVWMIRSREEWDAVVPGLVPKGISVPPPDVNWRRHAVIIASLEMRNMDRRRVLVQKARRLGVDLLIEVVYEEPEAILETQSVSAPFHLVLVEAPGVRRMHARVERVTGGMSDLGSAGTSGAAPVPIRSAGDPVRPTTVGGVKALYHRP